MAFSFILGIPAVLGANIFEVKDALAQGTQMELLPMLTGMVVAAVVGFLAIKLVRWLARSGNFKVFTWYTAILGTATVVIGVVEKLSTEFRRKTGILGGGIRGGTEKENGGKKENNCR